MKWFLSSTEMWLFSHTKTFPKLSIIPKNEKYYVRFKALWYVIYGNAIHSCSFCLSCSQKRVDSLAFFSVAWYVWLNIFLWLKTIQMCSSVSHRPIDIYISVITNLYLAFHSKLKSVLSCQNRTNFQPISLNSQKSEVAEKYILSYSSVLANLVIFVESRNFESGNVMLGVFQCFPCIETKKMV